MRARQRASTPDAVAVNGTSDRIWPRPDRGMVRPAGAGFAGGGAVDGQPAGIRRLTFGLTVARRRDPILWLAVRESGAVTVIDVSGELHASSVELLTRFVARVLDEAMPTLLVLNLAQLRYFSVAGIAALLRIRSAAGSLVLRRPSPQVLKVLIVTDLLDCFDIQG